MSDDADSAGHRRLDRIDFAQPDTYCSAKCGQPLKFAHVVIEAGRPFFYGPECILKLYGGNEAAYREEKSRVPDLTRFAQLPSGPQERSTRSGCPQGHRDENTARLQFAAEYLWVRLSGLIKCSPDLAKNKDLRWDVMEKVFERLQTNGKLEHPDIMSVVTTDLRTREKGGRRWLSHRNLMEMYAVLRQSERLHAMTSSSARRNLLQGLSSRVARHHFLIPADVALARELGVKLGKDPFSWAPREYSRRKK